ncbi:BnaC09g31910D [Brassica napus]|uniref:BnaC09g31910D protein n=1 Tax=Brassica napus TaxID=3708 RepID=A0A078G023_BRANA|nr:BnaC09g31910D [Brassica napus]
MEEELKNFIKVWFYAIISVSYCYYLSSRIKPGALRLLSVLPVIALFLFIPLFFSSVHFSGASAFFFTWLANFKLILFSFDKGPLYPLPQNLSRFIFFTCFPIKPQQNPKSQNQIPKWVFAIKVLVFGRLWGGWKVSPMVSRLLTVGFVVLTSGWLFFPPLIRGGMFVRLPNEALLFIDSVEHKFFTFGS